MKHLETARCYCFNPLCGKSIFKDGNDNTVFYTLEEVLSQPICCEECNAELVSKPVLEIQQEIYNAVLNIDIVQSILVTKEQLLTIDL